MMAFLLPVFLKALPTLDISSIASLTLVVRYFFLQKLARLTFNQNKAPGFIGLSRGFIHKKPWVFLARKNI
jgi:hypothetical protein